MSLYLGTQKIAANSSSREIGEIIQSTIPLTDAGLHLLDGALISSAGSYAKFVNYIAGLVSNYPDLFTTESNWQSSVSTYGVCGKFVYDSTNNTVRLPKITGFTDGTTDVTALGDLVEAGLPNITGSFFGEAAMAGSTGAFYVGNNPYRGSVSGSKNNQVNFDASHSSSIYGNSSTVQPQSIKVLYYIVIATMTKTDIQVDIDEIATDLNGKADVDLSNVNASGTSLASGWSMPSNRYIDLTLGASGATYTAPANGWVLVGKQTNGASLQNIYININGYPWGICWTSSSYNTFVYAPVCKGQIFNVNYTAGGATQVFRFYYAEGEGEN